MKIRATLALAAAAAMAVLVGAAGLALREASRRMIDVVAQRSIAGSGRFLAALEQADVEALDATVSRLLSDPAIADAFARRDRARLADLVVPRFRDVAANKAVTQWNFLLPDRTVFLRAQRPGDFGDLVERNVVVEAARSGDLAAGMDLGRTGFGLRLVRPWAPAGRLLGYVEIGEGAAHFLARMKAQTGDEYAIVVEKRHLERAEWSAASAAAGKADGWDELPGAVILDSTGADWTAFAGWRGSFASLPRDGVLIGRAAQRGRSYATGLVPIANAAGERVGALLIRHETTAIRAQLAGALRTSIWTVGALALAAVAVLVLLVDRLVFARLRRAADAIEELAARAEAGDRDLVARSPAASESDEVAAVERQISRLVRSIARKAP